MQSPCEHAMGLRITDTPSKASNLAELFDIDNFCLLAMRIDQSLPLQLGEHPADGFQFQT